MLNKREKKINNLNKKIREDNKFITNNLRLMYKKNRFLRIRLINKKNYNKL